MIRSRSGGLQRAQHRFAATFGDMAQARRWWVPGRLEMLGKHVDYGGGRSLLAAVDRGFHVVARPRSDRNVHLVDARTGARCDLAIDPSLPTQPGHWTDYPATVLRRIGRDFPEARTGLDMVVASSLPSAAGLSSSSALVIATALPLIAVNQLATSARWREAVPSDDALAGYLGALENGRAYGPFGADFGVGTQGGSQDHTAILRCRANEVAQYRYLPVEDERRITMPRGWHFVIAASGVTASKGGGAQARYNALSAEVSALIDLWRQHEDPAATSLLRILESEPAAVDRLRAYAGSHPAADTLRERLSQFREECTVLIPGVATALARGDLAAVGPLVARSHELAETVLRNQVPETIALVALAREQGAAAASAFGAGFGGSVWALVREEAAESFAAEWRRRYLAAFPEREARADVFVTAAADGARELIP